MRCKRPVVEHCRQEHTPRKWRCDPVCKRGHICAGRRIHSCGVEYEIGPAVEVSEDALSGQVASAIETREPSAGG